jgi:hypothetical protein
MASSAVGGAEVEVQALSAFVFKDGERCRQPEPNVLKMPRVCVLCGKEDPPSKCGKCGTPYCSKQCQAHDWTNGGHKLLCGMSMDTDTDMDSDGGGGSVVGRVMEAKWYPGAKVVCVEATTSKVDAAKFGTLRRALMATDDPENCVGPGVKAGAYSEVLAIPVASKAGSDDRCGQAYAMQQVGMLDDARVAYTDCYVGVGVVIAARRAGLGLAAAMSAAASCDDDTGDYPDDRLDACLRWKYPGWLPTGNLAYISFGKDIHELLAPPVQCVSRGHWILRVSSCAWAMVTSEGLWVGSLQGAVRLAVTGLLTWMRLTLETQYSLEHSAALALYLRLQLCGDHPVLNPEVHSACGAVLFRATVPLALVVE